MRPEGLSPGDAHRHGSVVQTREWRLRCSGFVFYWSPPGLQDTAHLFPPDSAHPPTYPPTIHPSIYHPPTHPSNNSSFFHQFFLPSLLPSLPPSFGSRACNTSTMTSPEVQHYSYGFPIPSYCGLNVFPHTLIHMLKS